MSSTEVPEGESASPKAKKAQKTQKTKKVQGNKSTRVGKKSAPAKTKANTKAKTKAKPKSQSKAQTKAKTNKRQASIKSATQTKTTRSRSQSKKRQARTVKADAVIAKAVEQARNIVAEVVKDEYIGEHLTVVGEAPRLATHYFACLHPGYVGWAWAVTMTRVPRAKTVTVCEVEMLPHKGALLAPDWLPWEERINPADGSNDDDDDYEAIDDPRLTEGRRHGEDEVRSRGDIDYDRAESPWEIDALRVNDLTLEVWDPKFLWSAE